MNPLQYKRGGLTGPLLVTGGAGFIGSALVRYLLRNTPYEVVNVDKLTYAGNLASLAEVVDNKRHHFVRADVSDAQAMRDVFARHQPCGVIHLAAESHVDRSIDGPANFIQTNVVGTATLLEQARHYWSELPSDGAAEFRFLHVSTDEVYGALGPKGAFTEQTRYDPSSPYSASKAGADHLVRAWHRTYGLPVLVTNCSNNYGPFQYPEKLIPVVILKGRRAEPIPVYGSGEHVRDWLFVQDHVEALLTVFEQGMLGETYNIGASQESSNIELVRRICHLLDEMVDAPATDDHASLITFVEDRPGHDARYAIDATKIERELEWTPKVGLDEGLGHTVRWYLNNLDWCRTALDEQPLERLGLTQEAT